MHYVWNMSPHFDMSSCDKNLELQCDPFLEYLSHRIQILISICNVILFMILCTNSNFGNCCFEQHSHHKVMFSLILMDWYSVITIAIWKMDIGSIIWKYICVMNHYNCHSFSVTVSACLIKLKYSEDVLLKY